MEKKFNIVILREIESTGTVKTTKAFEELEDARNFAVSLVSNLTTDSEQIKFVEEHIGDPVEFVDDDDLSWQIEIIETWIFLNNDS